MKVSRELTSALIASLEECIREILAERDAFYDAESTGDGYIADPMTRADLAEMDAIIDRAQAAIAKAKGDA